MEAKIGKNPAFQFYPGDWTRDLDDQPLEIEGAWIRICCRLHWSNPYGQATKSLIEWAYILRTHPNKAGVLLKTLLEKHIATGEYLDNQNITIISKRMVNDEKIRQIRREVGKLGGNPKLIKPPNSLDNQTSNQKITPSSSSSSSSSKIKTKSNQPSAAPVDNSTIKEIAEIGERLYQGHFPNVPKWINYQKKKNHHPKAILQTLKSMEIHKPGDYWAYGETVIKKENAKYNLDDSIKEHEIKKDLWNDLVDRLFEKSQKI